MTAGKQQQNHDNGSVIKALQRDITQNNLQILKLLRENTKTALELFKLQKLKR